MVTVWDVICPGAQRHISAEERVTTMHLVFPYRGVFVHHAGRAETVAEANQVVFLNSSSA
jgi:AraC family transcriptional regulator